MNNASQTCKDESCHLKLSAMEEKKNDLIVQRIPQIEKTNRCFERQQYS